MEAWRSGEIRIADHVIAVIAGLAAQEVPGIIAKASGLYEEMSKRISGKNMSRGIHVLMEEGATQIEMRVAVQYGSVIHHVCRQLQQRVKELVEDMTGLEVTQINVRVDSIEMKT